MRTRVSIFATQECYEPQAVEPRGDAVAVSQLAADDKALLIERLRRGEVALIAGDVSENAQCVCDTPLIAYFPR